MEHPALQNRKDPRTAAVWAALEEVPDPEIPTISVVDLGVIRDVRFEPADPNGSDGPDAAGERLVVEFLPTFVGCPALEIMRHTIRDRIAEFADSVEVRTTWQEQWTTDRISEQGRQKLKESGFAPPANDRPSPDGLVRVSECPFCGSKNTTLENPFGPTLCRAIAYCADCRQPFEQFKAV